jgi:hypothetical protein
MLALSASLSKSTRQAEAIEFALEQGLAGGDVLVARLQFEPVDDLRPRPRRGDVTQVRVQPVRLGVPCLLVMISTCSPVCRL